MKVYEGKLTAKGKRFGLIVSRFNDFVSKHLLEGALDCLRRHEAEEEKIEIAWVPGSFEIPAVAKKMALSKKYEAIICLGTIIRGETPHFDYIASEVAKGIAQVNLESGIPTIFGIITADTIEQAIDRAGTKSGNKGWDAALSAMELVNLYGQIG
ncbi:MAG: 6,7-dimethyl-8-ribityllumazine synthase [Candidatus Edwardsbacteria bacterium]